MGDRDRADEYSERSMIEGSAIMEEKRNAEERQAVKKREPTIDISWQR